MMCPPAPPKLIHTHTHTHAHTHLNSLQNLQWSEEKMKKETMHSRHVKWTWQTLAAATIKRKAKKDSEVNHQGKFKMKGGYI